MTPIVMHDIEFHNEASWINKITNHVAIFKLAQVIVTGHREKNKLVQVIVWMNEIIQMRKTSTCVTREIF